MTKQPVTVPRTTSVGDAHRLMHDQGIRHLPIVDQGQLVGVVSERDLHLIESLADALIAIPVERVMREHPFVVTSDTPIDEVAQIMADEKYGSVIIMGREGVEGILTTVDVCRALMDVLARAEVEALNLE